MTMSIHLWGTAAAASAAEVLEASRRRGLTLVKRDFDSLAHLLAEELRYTHATGATHDRPGYLEFVQKRLRFDSVRLEASSIGLDNEMAFLTGTLYQTVCRQNETEPVELVSSVTEVWSRRKSWRLAVFQSTRLPPA